MLVSAALGAKVAAGNPVAALIIVGALGFGVWLGFHRLLPRGGAWQGIYITR